MSTLKKGPRTFVLVLVLGLMQAACNSRSRGTDETAAVPVDTVQSDTAATAEIDTTAAPAREASVASPPVTPPQPEASRDTPPGGVAEPDGQTPGGAAPKVSQAEYEGWRQYSVNCARCHGQDALPNPVAANLLISLAPGGPMNSYEKFFAVVNEGRPERGMPGFKAILTADQTKAIHAYLKGRAEKRIPPGRPASP